MRVRRAPLGRGAADAACAMRGAHGRRTEEGKPLVLSAVRKAQRAIVDDPSRNKARARERRQGEGWRQLAARHVAPAHPAAPEPSSE